MKSKVAVYCACQNEKYLILALFSALELYNLNPYLDKIILLTDLDIFSEDEFKEYNIQIINVKGDLLKDATLKDIKGPYLNRKIKIWHYEYIKNFDMVMFVDADILPVSDCMDVWDMVREDEFGICANTFETVGQWGYYSEDTKESEYLRKNVSAEKLMYTAGFFVYQTGKNTKDFLKLWLEEWKIFKQDDTVPFLVAKEKFIDTEKKINLKVLDDRFNFCPSELRDKGLQSGKNAVHIHFKRWIYSFHQLPDLYRKHCVFSFPIISRHYTFEELKKIII